MFSIFVCNITFNIESIINDLHIGELNKNIMKQRYLKQVKLYNYKTRVTEFFYIFFSIFITIGTIITPAMLSIQGVQLDEEEETNELYKKRLYWFTWITSILITISNGLVQFFNLHKQYISYNSTKEKLISEGWKFFELSGKYKGKTHSENFISFCEEVEEIKKVQVEKELIFLSEPTIKENNDIKEDNDIKENNGIKENNDIKENKKKQNNLLLERDLRNRINNESSSKLIRESVETDLDAISVNNVKISVDNKTTNI